MPHCGPDGAARSPRRTLLIAPDLIFTRLALAVLGLAVVIFAQISRDGGSVWLEGVQLLTQSLKAHYG